MSIGRIAREHEAGRRLAREGADRPGPEAHRYRLLGWLDERKRMGLRGELAQLHLFAQSATAPDEKSLANESVTV